MEEPYPQTINVQANDNIGCPLTLGLRLLPKVIDGKGDSDACFGITIVVFSELWFRNLTQLPLCFGCPWSKPVVYENGVTSVESAGKAIAEAALAEMADILDFGNSTHVIESSRRVDSDYEMIAYQELDSACLERFEYLEVESSTVQRRWWASDHYDHLKRPISEIVPNEYWVWSDDQWVSRQPHLNLFNVLHS